jgi:hypothetical protein
VNLSDLFRERVGVDIREIAGAQVAGELPVGDTLVNRLIAERLAQHPQIASVRVQPQDNDTVGIQVVPRARLMPTLKLIARVERQPEFPDNPTLLLRWSMPAAGPLAMLAAPVLSMFKKMPAGITMDGDRIAVDLRALARSRGFDDALGYVRRLAIHTRPGGFVARFELGV